MKHEGILETDPKKMGKKMRLANQHVSHCRINPTFICGVLTFIGLFFIFAIIGLICYIKSKSLHELMIRYDDKCNGAVVCSFPVVLPQSMNNPNIYYAIDNFYHSHRKFAKSRSSN
jgi:hypothetical protein